MTQVHPPTTAAPENARSTRPAQPGEPTDEQLVAGQTPAEILAGPGTTALRRAWRRLSGRDPQTGLPIPAERPAGPDHPVQADPPPAVQPAPVTAPAAEPRRVNEWKDRQRAERDARRTTHRPVADRSGWAICGVAVLGLLVLTIVAVGLYTSLGALRDTGLAAHIEPSAANLWWIGIDGLIVVAIVAVVILRHDAAARRYALGVVIVFTAASGFLQFLHGLGWTTRAARSGEPGSLPWAVVAVIAVLIIGTIFCGTHLLVYVLRHMFPRALADQPVSGQTAVVEATDAAPEPVTTDPDTENGSGDEGRSGDGEAPLLGADTEREIRKWFAAVAVHLIIEVGGKPVRSKIAGSFEIADRQAGYVISDVIADREEKAAQQAALEAARQHGPTPPPPVAAINGSPTQGRPAGSTP